MKQIEMKGLNEVIHFEQLENGLPIYIWVNEKVNGFYATFSTKFGSIDTEFKVGNKTIKLPHGTAHFLEHLKFNEPNGKNAQDFYQEMGSDINAFTTFDFTSYLVYGTEKIEENLKHLIEFVLTPEFNEKMVNNEKGIITEENKMDQDNPSNKLFYGAYQNLFYNYNQQFLITGTEKDIKDTSLVDIQNAFQYFYHPKNMFVVVTGKVNPYDVVKTISEATEGMEFEEFKEPKRKQLKEPARVVKDFELIETNVEIPKLKYSLKIPRKKFNVDDLKLRIILSLILNCTFGTTSDLREELKSKNLILYMNADRILIEDYVIISITIETNYPDEIIKILDESWDLQVNERDIKRKIKSSIANMVLAYDDITEVNGMIQDYLVIYEELITDLKEIYENLSMEEVNEVLNKISAKEKSVIVLKPKK